jgi:hypothetical protein
MLMALEELKRIKDAIESGDIIVRPNCRTCMHLKEHWSQKPCCNCYGQADIGEKGDYYEGEGADG